MKTKIVLAAIVALTLMLPSPASMAQEKSSETYRQLNLLGDVFERVRSDHPSVRPLRPARGRLVFPAQGRVVRHFNEKTAFGARSKGITIETLAAAQIIAPYAGRVVFSGPFRGYGQLLIIEHGGGYHTLLAGLHRIDSVTSQWLLAGEPVGVMTRPVKGNPRLYIELRRNGRPINPLPWLAPPTDKASG